MRTHKYIRKEPNGKGGYRYYYNTSNIKKKFTKVTGISTKSKSIYEKYKDFDDFEKNATKEEKTEFNTKALKYGLRALAMGSNAYSEYKKNKKR